MIKTILFLFSVMFTVCAKAQSYPYEEGYRLYLDSHFDKAYPLFKSALSLYHERADSQGEFKSLREMGDCLYYQGKLDACLIDYTKALQVASKMGNKNAEYEILTLLKKAYSEKKDMRNVMGVSNKIDSLLNTSKSSSLTLPQMYSNAKMAYSNNNIKLAEYYYLKIEEMLDTLSNDPEKSNHLDFYRAIRDFYTETKQYEKALDYSKKYITCAKDHLSSSHISTYYAEEARIYGFMKQKDKVIEDLDIARKGFRIDEDPYNVNNFFYHFWAATSYQELKEWEKCASEYRKTIAVLEKNEMGDDFIYSMKAALAGALYQLGEYDEARNMYHEYAQYCKKNYGENSLKYASALKYLANIEGFCNDIENGEKHYAECMAILKDLVRKQYHFVSLEERNKFWDEIEPSLTRIAAE